LVAGSRLAALTLRFASAIGFGIGLIFRMSVTASLKDNGDNDNRFVCGCYENNKPHQVAEILKGGDAWVIARASSSNGILKNASTEL
jgi:hypothetical protein